MFQTKAENPLQAATDEYWQLKSEFKPHIPI